MSIRIAKKGDEFAILDLIKGLAEFEKEPEAVINTADQLGKDLFDDNICDAFVAIEDSKIVGFALYYTSYSTWKGACVYLEDLFVLPEMRGKNIGSDLFESVVEIAKERGVKRLDWQVLDWNEPAIEFYKQKGATLDPEWLNGRMFF